MGFKQGYRRVVLNVRERLCALMFWNKPGAGCGGAEAPFVGP